MKQLSKRERTVQRKKWMYLAEYRCSCTDLQDYRKDLLSYCGTHGDNVVNVYKLPYDPKPARGAKK